MHQQVAMAIFIISALATSLEWIDCIFICHVNIFGHMRNPLSRLLGTVTNELPNAFDKFRNHSY